MTQSAPHGGTPRGSSGPTNDTELRGHLQSLLGSTALLAGAAYGGFHWILSRFYGSFGLTPEDLGWDLRTTLARFTGVIAYTTASVMLSLLLGRIFMRGESVPAKRRERINRIGIVGAVILVATLFLSVFVSSLTWDDRLRDGKSVTRSAVLFSIPTPCVTAIWVEPAKMTEEGTPVTFDRRKEFRLLGSGTTTTLYDPKSDQITRIPSTLIILESCR
jgi:hypothetical protein